MSYDFLLTIAIIMLFTKVFGLTSERVHMPQVVGALIAGVLVGPSCLGWVGETDFLVKAAEIGVIILMFNAGMDTDLDELKTTGFASFVIALIGVIVPLIGGVACYLAFDNDPTDPMNMLKAAFIGVVLTATSVSITVETLREMGKLKSKVGTAILGAAVIDDILGIVVLTILTALTDPVGKADSGTRPHRCVLRFRTGCWSRYVPRIPQDGGEVASSSPYCNLCGSIRIPDELCCRALLRYCRYHRCILRRHRNVPSVLCA